MSLAKTRTTTYTTSEFVEPADLTIGVGTVTVTIDWWDAPVVGYSLMLRRETVQTRRDGIVTYRTVETWDYDGLFVGDHQVPMSLRKQVYARVWLPGVNWRERLQLVEESRTTYDYATEFSEGPLKSRTVTAGYVIYDLAAEQWDGDTPTPDGSTARAHLDARGQKPPAGSTRVIPDTARSWRSAIGQAAIVEERQANQLALWVDPFEETREDVEIDGQIIRRWRTRHDYLTGLTEVDGPSEERKPGLVGEFPFEVAPPQISATDAQNAGVRVEIRGGGAVIEQWVGVMAPVRRTQKIAPDVYAVYRRVVARGPRTYTGDPYTIVSPPPPRGPGWPRSELLDVQDLTGASTVPIPPAEPDTEPETPTIPDAEVWQHVGDVKNSADPNAEGHATIYDREVEAGWTYEYFATARIKEQVSGESNHESVTYTGPLSFRSTIGVRIVPGHTDITLDIVMPPDPIVDDLGIVDGATGWGEVLTIDPLPAILDTASGETVAIDGSSGYGDGNPGAWTGGCITDAVDLGRAIGLRQGLRNRDRDAVHVTLAAPILGMDRGQAVTLPDMPWKTAGAGVVMRAQALASSATWVIEGYETTVAMGPDGVMTVIATLDVEEM